MQQNFNEHRVLFGSNNKAKYLQKKNIRGKERIHFRGALHHQKMQRAGRGALF
jgi:hypothetical protein